MHEFDSKDLKRLFGIPASQVRSLVRAGHIHPRKSFSAELFVPGSHRASHLGVASSGEHSDPKDQPHAARDPRVAPRERCRSGGLSIVAVGDRIVVREGQALRESDTGQYTLALEVIDKGGDLVMIDKHTGAASAAEASAPARSADEQFESALELEDDDSDAARAAYEACLAADPHHLEARLNLGRLLHLAGRLHDAERVYRGAHESEPLLSFNLAVLLEDLDREEEAIAAYRRALALDPALADAHFNLARLHERAGHPRDALRHLLAYRRLINEH